MKLFSLVLIIDFVTRFNGIILEFDPCIGELELVHQVSNFEKVKLDIVLSKVNPAYKVFKMDFFGFVGLTMGFS